MAITDTIITILVLVGVFLLAYSAIRHQGIKETINELKETVKGGATDKLEEFKYR